MARIQVISDDGSVVVPVELGTDSEGEEWTTATCPTHGPIEADHSYFRDMIEAAVIHVDHQH